MTEYDYSPGAYERHLAKQAGIARWVDHTNEYTPANPFRPLPDVPDEHGSHSSHSSHPLQSNASLPPTPANSYSSGSSRQKKSRHTRSHSNATTASPQPTALRLPLGGGLWATQAQLAQPMSSSNMTTGPIPPQSHGFPYRNSEFPSPTASAVHQSFGGQTQFAYGQQYSTPSACSSPHSAYRTSTVYSHPPNTSPSVQSLPLSGPPSSSGVTYVPNPNQPVVVSLHRGGMVILPPGQQVQVISPKDYYGTESKRDIDLDGSKQAFFGGLAQGRNRTRDSSRNAYM